MASHDMRLNARAHANIAWTHVCSIFIEVTDETSIGEALRHIETSLDIDDSDAWSHGVYAQLLFLLRRDCPQPGVQKLPPDTSRSRPPRLSSRAADNAR
jgi:hypothetical protein